MCPRKEWVYAGQAPLALFPRIPVGKLKKEERELLDPVCDLTPSKTAIKKRILTVATCSLPIALVKLVGWCLIWKQKVFHDCSYLASFEDREEETGRLVQMKR